MTLPAPEETTIPGAASDTHWQRYGLCRNECASLFFGAENETRDERTLRETEANRVCEHCPVLLRCRNHALTHHEQYGIWGGLTERDRIRHRLPSWRSPGRRPSALRW
ncbi:WhiB family transcriptional regulator [Rhodococcus rhodochrous]|uniref:WhiB family transcriptional regulator n=1 Tax=Rhodococcus rhodochrous TaxID=1829 RepID=UPI0011A0E3CC|nr:WhiB family transcriptional regulator [Rhodococcus rhodochrous]